MFYVEFHQAVNLNTILLVINCSVLFLNHNSKSREIGLTISIKFSV